MKHVISSDKRNDEWIVLSAGRFALALCVVLTHLWNVAPDSSLAQCMGWAGHAAIFGFFMISGYSIAASITARKEGYIFRRIKRIYPAYLFAIVLCFFLTLPGGMHSPSGQIIHAASLRLTVENMFMLQGVWKPTIEADAPFWTLSVEWWLYMLALIFMRLNNKFLTLSAFAVFVGAIIDCHIEGIVRESQFNIGLVTLFWAVSWIGGFAYYRDRSKISFILMLLPSLMMLDNYMLWPYAAIIAILSALTVASASTFDIRDPYIRKGMIWLGDVSYPLYLLHYPLLFAVVTYTSVRNGYLLVSIMLSIVLTGYYLTQCTLEELSSMIVAKWDFGLDSHRDKKYRWFSRSS